MRYADVIGPISRLRCKQEEKDSHKKTTGKTNAVSWIVGCFVTKGKVTACPIPFSEAY